MIERFHQTLKKKLHIHMTTSGKNDWLSILPAIVENYNNTVHTTTKRTPEEVYNNINSQLEVKQIFQAKRFETNPVNDLFIGEGILIYNIYGKKSVRKAIKTARILRQMC